jgi:putative ABC transport system substrate-binding protein
MKRREFITPLGGTAAAGRSRRAQQAGMPLVGFITPRSAERSTQNVAAFRKGLAETEARRRASDGVVLR